VTTTFDLYKAQSAHTDHAWEVAGGYAEKVGSLTGAMRIILERSEKYQDTDTFDLALCTLSEIADIARSVLQRTTAAPEATQTQPETQA
jgi:hypothetical protein